MVYLTIVFAILIVKVRKHARVGSAVSVINRPNHLSILYSIRCLPLFMLKFALLGCGALRSCAADKAAPTCQLAVAGAVPAVLNTCICGLNDVNGNGVANIPVQSCFNNQQAPTCAELKQTDNPANFQCVCGANGPCKAGTICEKDVNGKEKCVVKCPVACPGTEQCDIFHRICRCGASTTCRSFPRAPNCNNAGNACVCNLAANTACATGERCEIDGAAPGNHRCRCGNNPPCGARGQCIKGECRCGAVGANGCAGAAPTCNIPTNVCRACVAGNIVNGVHRDCTGALNAAGVATPTCLNGACVLPVCVLPAAVNNVCRACTGGPANAPDCVGAVNAAGAAVTTCTSGVCVAAGGVES